MRPNGTCNYLFDDYRLRSRCLQAAQASGLIGNPDHDWDLERVARVYLERFFDHARGRLQRPPLISKKMRGYGFTDEMAASLASPAAVG